MTGCYVYIIYSQKLDKYYVGHTIDVTKRVEEHNNGISTYTAKANDWILKYLEHYFDRKTAMSREREIKKKKSRVYVERLIELSE